MRAFNLDFRLCAPLPARTLRVFFKVWASATQHTRHLLAGLLIPPSWWGDWPALLCLQRGLSLCRRPLLAEIWSAAVTISSFPPLDSAFSAFGFFSLCASPLFPGNQSEACLEDPHFLTDSTKVLSVFRRDMSGRNRFIRSSPLTISLSEASRTFGINVLAPLLFRDPSTGRALCTPLSMARGPSLLRQSSVSQNTVPRGGVHGHAFMFYPELLHPPSSSSRIPPCTDPIIPPLSLVLLMSLSRVSFTCIGECFLARYAPFLLLFSPGTPTLFDGRRAFFVFHMNVT